MICSLIVWNHTNKQIEYFTATFNNYFSTIVKVHLYCYYVDACVLVLNLIYKKTQTVLGWEVFIAQ